MSNRFPCYFSVKKMGVEMRILNMEPDQDKSAFFPVVKFICTTECDTDSYPLGKETFIK